jgi:hypothetical protein
MSRTIFVFVTDLLFVKWVLLPSTQKERPPQRESSRVYGPYFIKYSERQMAQAVTRPNSALLSNSTRFWVRIFIASA